MVGVVRLGFATEDFGMHSLCSGRAMVMHIFRVLDHIHVNIGWWRSLVFMFYIQQLISFFIASILVHMIQKPFC